jgi:hypothetical protein
MTVDVIWPMSTAEERVDAAVERFLEDRNFNAQQLEWMERNTNTSETDYAEVGWVALPR